MGEIADALKRANDQRVRDREAARERTSAEIRKTSEAAARQQAPVSSGDHSEALARAHAEDAVEAPATADSPYTTALELTESFGPVHEAPERAVELEISDELGPYSQARAVLHNHQAGTAEAFRHFALRVSREAALLGNRAIAIVSAVRGEGKTTTACNLSLALASVAGEKATALVDLDLRRPALGRYLGATPAVGIDAVLRGKASVEQACVTTNFPYLDVYPIVRPVSQPHELLAGEALADTIAQLRSRYHTVIIDTPPVLLVPDVELLLPFVGGAVIVVRSRKTRVDASLRLMEVLPRDKLLGCFLNEERRHRRSREYSDYYLPDEDVAAEFDGKD